MTAAKKTRKAAPRAGAGKARQSSGKAGASPKTRARRPAAQSKTARAEPTGFGGWLWLLVIGQLLVTARMIDTLMKMAALFGGPVWQAHRGLVITDLALYGAAFFLQLLVLAALALRKAQFVPLFITAVVAYFLIGRLEPLLAIAFLGMDPSRLISRAVLLPMAVEFGVGLLWGAYVLMSRRVRNTFVR
ncbi:DUF2569 domain-containing protein [Mesorhizobium sp. BR1-1-16]|uniref:DUF2569 family protein n=1 Tax=Mesorhizobium sp. BR1-1-16 TaxID=2876653 RepID=UPI001CCF909C|nr:DUF2569 domain-containing protein [Mesorhizobium sp. BR1-1-16]